MTNKLNPKTLTALIEAFLTINPEPSDQQFHALADALAVDREVLEAVSYKMLGDEIEQSNGSADLGDYGLQAGSLHFGNDSTLEDPEDDTEVLAEPETTEHPGQVILQALSTHFPAGEDMCSRQDAIAEVFDQGSDFESIGASATKRIQAARRVMATTPTEEVLSGDYDEADLTTDELLLNDGQLEVNNTNPGFQEETDRDGTTVLDRGVGLEHDQALLNQDGIASPEIVDKNGNKAE